MTFRRTDNGLSNLGLFLGVDVVVFVEGGSTLTLDEIAIGGSSTSIDMLYWRKVFELFPPAASLDFRAVGSKTTLREIAKGVRAGCISRVFVCMDRDWDHLDCSLVRARGVFYTFGYSWENDSWDRDVLLHVFRVLCPVTGASADWVAEVEAALRNYHGSMSWPTIADAIAGASGWSVLPKREPESLILASAGKRPEIDGARLRTLLHQTNQTKCQRFRVPFECDVSVERDCFGHLKAAFFYRILVFLLRTQRWTHSLTKDHAAAMAIENMELAFAAHPEQSHHYQSQVAYLSA